MSQTTHRYILSSARMLSSNARHLIFEREDKQTVNYLAGQFFSIHIETPEKVIRRNFSIANPPLGGCSLELACAYVPNGLATGLLSQLQPGDSVQMSGPYGLLVLKDETPRRYILVATGTGVTPYRAMLPELARRMAEQDLEVVLLFGAREPSELLYAEDFINFAQVQPKFRFMACFSRNMPNDAATYAYKGYVQDQFKELALKPDQELVYLCGNPNMIDQSFQQLLDMGFDRKSIRREKYISSP
jgi:ferredoxin-NADP reductase